MTESGSFCPQCGDPVAPSTDRSAVPGPAGARQRRERALCDACFFERFDLIDAPDRLVVRVCQRCGAVHRGSRWTDIGADDVTDVAVEAVRESLGVHVEATAVDWRVEPEQVDPNTVRMHCTFAGTVRNTPLHERAEVLVQLSRETCTRCGRIAGDYYAGLVQVRAAVRSPTAEETDRAVAIAHDVVAEMEATGDRNAFVTEVSETEGGIDIKVSTTKIGEKVARRVIREFGGRFDSSETLVTEDEDGAEVYRVTYAVRLPPFVPGEVIAPDAEGPVLVTSVRGNVKGRRLATGEPYEADPTAVADARRLGHRDEATETTLVAVEDEHAVQVLDPETARARTVPRPADLDTEAESVPVLKCRAGLFVIPSGESAGH